MSPAVRTTLIGTIRSLAACLIAYAFVVVLMTASAQQRVMAALDEKSEPSDYSSALIRLKETEGSRAALDKAQGSQRALLDKESRLSAALSQAKDQTDEAWVRFLPIARRVAVEPGCRISLDGPNIETWTAALQCASEGSLSPRLTKQIDDASHAPNNFGQAYAAARAAQSELGAVGYDLKRVAQDIERNRAEVQQAGQLQSAFGELNVLRHTWMLGGGVLSEFPPALMHIILAFVAGAFGALLITVVLAVYPTNEFHFTQGEGHEARVFLGGLISLCVFIVLSGGTSILGNDQPFNGGEANVMTFSAVGILAGMFSDRVAGWLSDKASAFFKKNEDVPHG
jgi:hypothetical protein